MDFLLTMPSAAPTPCRAPGCGALVRSGYCERHADRAMEHRREHDSRRPTRTQRGYTNRWLRAAKAHLRKEPLCRHCEQQGRITPATEVDHIQAHKGDPALFWNARNWQSLCKPCHSRKTATTDRMHSANKK